MRLIIAGSRSITNYNALLRCLRLWWSDELKISTMREAKDVIHLIISGTANGVDKLGERFAEENHIPLLKMPADWNTYGKSAGYIRNEEMAKEATACIILWDGASKGTKHMIDLAKKYKLQLWIYKLTETGNYEMV